MASRPPTPPDVRQILRNEAFFGCCRCGFPVYQYHHIIPYEKEQHFRPEDMMILCTRCHEMATKGVLKEAKQRHFKQNPFNRKHNFVHGKLWVDEAPGTVVLSDISLVGDGCFVSVGPKCLVKLEVGPERNLDLSLSLYDKSDNLLLDVERSEWRAGEPSIWDMESDYQYLKLRSKPHDVLLEIDARKDPLCMRAQLWYQGTRIDCRPSRMVLNSPSVRNMVVSGGSLSGHRVAVSGMGKPSESSP